MHNPHRHIPLLITVAALLSACALPFIGRDRDAADTPDITVTEQPGDDVMRPLARRIAGQDTDAAAQPPEPGADGFLGETLAGLGAPGEAGMWLLTGLVAQVQTGRIINASGTSLAVELRPSGADAGAGSQISLMAMQSLGLPLGQLATLRVFVD